jgi:hypothetical protein
MEVGADRARAAKTGIATRRSVISLYLSLGRGLFGLARQGFSDIVNGHRKHEARDATEEHAYAH